MVTVKSNGTVHGPDNADWPQGLLWNRKLLRGSVCDGLLKSVLKTTGNMKYRIWTTVIRKRT